MKVYEFENGKKPQTHFKCQLLPKIHISNALHRKYQNQDSQGWNQNRGLMTNKENCDRRRSSPFRNDNRNHYDSVPLT